MIETAADGACAGQLRASRHPDQADPTPAAAETRNAAMNDESPAIARLSRLLPRWT